MELRARLHPLGEASRARLAEILVPMPPAVSARFPVAVTDPSKVALAVQAWIEQQNSVAPLQQ